MSNLWLAIWSCLIGLCCLVFLTYGILIYSFEGIEPDSTKMILLSGIGLLSLGATIYFARRHTLEKRR